VKVTELTWLEEPSVESVRGALTRRAHDVLGRSVTLQPWIEAGNPEWSSGSAIVDGSLVAKFAWSKPAAERLWYEARILRALTALSCDLRLPDLVTTSDDPVLVVTRLVAGDPLTSELITGAGSEIAEIGSQLALFLSNLHRPDILARVSGTLGPLDTPRPQATTADLRARIAPWVRADQLEEVYRWCEWVDDILSDTGDPVLVHGDLHGHNQVWDGETFCLRAVVDFEGSGAAEAEYDFRYLPAQGPSVDILLATVSHYQARSDRVLRIEHIMAWHILTVLGDALWRSEAGAPLPGGGTPPAWVDELGGRLDLLAVGP